jgi:hypothetical protein
MKKNLLLFFAATFLFTATNVKAQQLYSNTTFTTPTHYYFNPGFVGNTPDITLDDIQINYASLPTFDTIDVTLVKFEVAVVPNAAASTAKIYYTLVSDTSTSAGTAPSLPVLLSTISLPAGGASGGNYIISAGDSVHTLFSVPKFLDQPFSGYQTFFLGLSFSDSLSATHNGPAWYLAKATETNDDAAWLYNPKSDPPFDFIYFGGTPKATFYAQVFGYTATALPVHFTSFNGVLQNNEAVLNWSTASEINNKGFNVEKSADGKTFTDIGFVSGNGTTQKLSNYTFSDPKLLSGDNYYRLKQIDLDGKFTYSSVIKLEFNKFDWTIIGNPSNNSSVQLQLDKQHTVAVQIVSLAGNVIQTISKGTLGTGTYSIPLDFSHAASGMYVVRMIIDGQSSAKNIVK